MMPLLGAALTVAACYGLGAFLIGRLGVRLDRYEHLPLAFLLGAACLHLAVLALLALKIAYWPVVVCLLLCAGGVGSLVRLGRVQGDPRGPGGPPHLAALLFLPFLALGFFHAWAPESSPDGAAYHLGLVARYVRAHGFERITTNMYAGLSEGVEMLFVPAFIIGRHSAAALVHFAFAIALALTMFAYGRRIGKPWAGIAAAFLTFASPVVGIDASSAYNDVALAAVAFAVFYWLQIWDDLRQDSVLILTGLLCGYAYAVKYTGFVMLPFAIGFVAYRSRRWKALVLVTVCATPMIAPWMIKDWIYVRNPVAPVANRIFRNPYIHIAAEDEWSANLRRYDLQNKWTLPFEVTLRGEKTAGLIGPVFLLAPIALFALREKAGRRLLAAGTLLLATYFANIGTRFLIPCLPFFSLAMALPLANSTPALAAIMVFHAVASWPPIVDWYSPHSWHLTPMLYREALRIVPEDAYLRETFPPYGAAQLIDAHVPEGERVLSVSAVADAYTSRDVLVSYQAAFNESLADSIDMGWKKESQPRVLETFFFPEKQIRRIRVLETGAGNSALEQWSIHELRFFDRGAELPRRPDWRLDSWPNAEDAWLAFDNSPATRWRTWERARPGMYLAADFGRAESVDQVKIETSYDYFTHAFVTVEVMNDSGDWVPVARDPAVTVLDPGPQIRREATRSIRARGVQYLLLHEEDFGAKEIRDDPGGWGLSQVAGGYGVRLYQVAP